MEESGLSQTRLAEVLGIDNTLITKILKGDNLNSGVSSGKGNLRLYLLIDNQASMMLDESAVPLRGQNGR
jgi:plasmid maintenance system antidote protein VapI